MRTAFVSFVCFPAYMHFELCSSIRVVVIEAGLVRHKPRCESLEAISELRKGNGNFHAGIP